ncbi:hypothetical protein E1B28_003318 [Marasmius oreades]|uniref:Uncharacterized protein n=1 Tax=Marasmius oreades TaxID=181124 RepID=A0A9P7RLZ5_9AGAR|nr:uncharacterized protein E1B28_003318 [Marasmius oreades]KAG7085777.1 hypothetical protein E1B28_003318 [Marasmius oreades]
MTTPANKMGSLEEFSAAEHIFNDPNSWRRESGRDWASEDDSTPSAAPSDGLRSKRKPKPPSFTLKPFTKGLILPVNEPTPYNVSTPGSVYLSPLLLTSAPESPFDLERVYGLDFEDIYGLDSDSPLVKSESGWTGLADKEVFERSQILARLIETSKNITSEMSELVKQRVSIISGQGTIFRAFPTPNGFEFDFEGGDFLTPDAGIATGGFAYSSPGSIYSSTSDQTSTKHPTRPSLKKGLRISTTTGTTTTTVISIDSPSNKSSPGITIVSAVSTSTPYSILDFYETSPVTTEKSPKTTGLLTSSSQARHSSSQSIVPKTSHPTATTFSTPTVPSPSAGSRSAATATFSLTKVTTIDYFLSNDSAKIIELPEDIGLGGAPLNKKPPSLSIVTSVPSRPAYQGNAMVKEITPLMVTKKETKHSESRGQASPRPLPKVPRTLTPPPPVPALPTFTTVPPVSELPSGTSHKAPSSVSSKIARLSTTGSQSRPPTRKRSAQASRPRSPPAVLLTEPLPSPPQLKLSHEDSKADSITEVLRKGRTLGLPFNHTPLPTEGDNVSTLGVKTESKVGQKKDEKALPSDPRESTSQNRMRIAKRSATPPPRGSRSQKKRHGLSPVPSPLPSGAGLAFESGSSITAVPLPSLTDELTASSSTEVIPSTLLAALPPPPSPTSSSGSTYPSPSLFPLPPAVVSRIDPSNLQCEPLATDDVAATNIQASAASVTEIAGDAHSSSGSLVTVVKGQRDDEEGGGGTTGHVADPPVIHITVVNGKGSPSTSVPDLTHVPPLPSSRNVEEALESAQVRDVSKARNASLIVSTASVADLVKNAYAHGIPPVDENSPEVVLLRADSPKRLTSESQGTANELSSSRTWRTVRHARSTSRLNSTESLARTSLNSTSNSEISRTRSVSDHDLLDDGSQVKRGNTLRHSRSAVQLGLSKVPFTKLGSLFERDILLPDRSLLERRTRGNSVDDRPLVTDAFEPVGNDVRTTTLQTSSERQDGSFTWRKPSTGGLQSATTGNSSSPSISVSKPEWQPHSKTLRIPSEILSVRGSTNSSEMGVASLSRPESSGSLQSNPFPALVEKKESVGIPVVKESIGVSPRAGDIPADGVTPAQTSAFLPVAVPPARSLTPVSFGKLPLEPTFASSRTHRRSVSEKLPQSTISLLTTREQRRALTPMQTIPVRSTSVGALVATSPSTAATTSTTPMHRSKSSIDEDPVRNSSPWARQVRHAPVPTADALIPPVPIPTASTYMPLPSHPKPTDTISRSTPTHSPKPPIESIRRRAPTPTPSDRKRLPSDALPPVPSTVHLPSTIPQSVPLQMEEVKRAPTPSSLTRSRLVSTAFKDLPLPPVPSGVKNTPIDWSADDRVRRTRTPSGSTSSNNVPGINVPDATLLARRYRKPSISAESRSANAPSWPSLSSSSTTSGGSESSARRFAQPTVSSSAKLKQGTSSSAVPTSEVLGSGTSSYNVLGSKVQPPPLPPKAELRGRVRARLESPMSGGRARSVPRKAREGGNFVEQASLPSSYEDEVVRRGRGRPSSPTRERGRSGGPNADGREIRRSLYARSRSVGPTSAEQVVKARKRTSSLSVAPPPVPNSSLLLPGRSPSRVPSPSYDIIRGRVSPFPVTPTLSSSSRPSSRALTSF